MLLQFITDLFRKAVRQGIVQGVEEALDELDLAVDQRPDALDSLKERLSLPAPAKGKGKNKEAA